MVVVGEVADGAVVVEVAAGISDEVVVPDAIVPALCDVAATASKVETIDALALVLFARVFTGASTDFDKDVGSVHSYRALCGTEQWPNSATYACKA